MKNARLTLGASLKAKTDKKGNPILETNNFYDPYYGYDYVDFNLQCTSVSVLWQPGLEYTLNVGEMSNFFVIGRDKTTCLGNWYDK